jgi:hypothetical protein
VTRLRDHQTLVVIGLIVAFMVYAGVVQTLTDARWPIAVPMVLFISAALIFGRRTRWYECMSRLPALAAVLQWWLGFITILLAAIIAVSVNTVSSLIAQRHTTAQ